MSEESKVIKFERRDRPPLTVKPLARHCEHKHMVVDVQNRILFCGDCEAVIDPISFLVKWAYEDKSLETRIKNQYDQLKQLGKHLAKLRKMQRDREKSLIRMGVKPPKTGWF